MPPGCIRLVFVVLVSFQCISGGEASATDVAHVAPMSFVASSFEDSWWCVEEALAPRVKASTVVMLPLEVVLVVVETFDEFTANAAEVHVLIDT